MSNSKANPVYTKSPAKPTQKPFGNGATIPEGPGLQPLEALLREH